MEIDDKELKKLNEEKATLIRNLEIYTSAVSNCDMNLTNKQIDKATYELQIQENKLKVSVAEARLNELNSIISAKTREIINSKISQNNIKEEPKMADEAKVEEKKRGKKEKKDSYSQLIVANLMKKGVKDVDTCVAKVLEEKPGKDSKKIKGQVLAIIGCVKRGKEKRWTKYTWDEEKFLLTEKGQ